RDAAEGAPGTGGRERRLELVDAKRRERAAPAQREEGRHARRGVVKRDFTPIRRSVQPNQRLALLPAPLEPSPRQRIIAPQIRVWCVEIERDERIGPRLANLMAIAMLDQHERVLLQPMLRSLTIALPNPETTNSH